MHPDHDKKPADDGLVFYFRVINQYWFEAQGMVQCGMVRCSRDGVPLECAGDSGFIAFIVSQREASSALATGQVVRVQVGP